jgi:pyruvate,water dikinase
MTLVASLPMAGADPSLLGGKGAGLSRLMDLGLPVPPGFVITTAAWPGAASMALSAGLVDEVTRALAALEPGPFAVRSSAADEDSATHSFAGLYDTFLELDGARIVDVAGVLEAVRRCWASARSPRVLAYRQARGRPPTPLAVVVQRLVLPDLAGVLFTCDPVAGDPSRAVVEAVGGLGEALVSGRADPDRAVIDKRRHAVLERVGALLDDVTLRRLLDLGLFLERSLGGPQDIEWALAGGTLFVLQARPVTTPVGAGAPREGRGVPGR